jgi:zinc protease
MSDPDAPTIFSLPCGLQVIAVQRPWSKLVSAVLIYRAGTFDDPINIPGTAHFIEHLAFAGENKPLVAQLGTLGTRVSGHTTYDHTQFSATGHVDDFDQSLRFIANIVRHRPITAEDIFWANETCSSTS